MRKRRSGRWGRILKPIRKTAVQSLRTTLTDDDRLRLSSDIGRASQDHAAARERAKEVTAQAKANVERHRNELERIGTILANGYEWRDVRVEVIVDLDLRMVTTTRTDTGEVIEQRPARMDELQGELDI